MNHSDDEIVPAAAPHEIVVDDEPVVPTGSAPWIMPVVLFAGLLLTLLLSRAGLRFFFLPIILPFGFGGGRVLRQLLPSRRVIRFEAGKLWLASEGAFRTSTQGLADVSEGAFVTLGSSGLWMQGEEAASVRVIAREGAVTVPVRGGEKVRRIRQEVEALFAVARVPLLEADAALQGELSVTPFADGVQIQWTSEGFSGGLLGRRSSTALRVTPDGWALRVRSGARVLVSTGGPGKLAGRVVELEQGSPLGASVAQSTVVLELVADGEVAGQIGAELSEPELNWLAERIERAAA